jgi:hypothetical protein
MRTGDNRKPWINFIKEQGGTYLKALYHEASGRQTSIFKRNTPPKPVLQIMVEAPENIPDKLCMLLAKVKRSAEQAGFRHPQCRELAQNSFINTFGLDAGNLACEDISSAKDKQQMQKVVQANIRSFVQAKNTDDFNVFLDQLIARGDRALNEMNQTNQG